MHQDFTGGQVQLELCQDAWTLGCHECTHFWWWGVQCYLSLLSIPKFLPNFSSSHAKMNRGFSRGSFQNFVKTLDHVFHNCNEYTLVNKLLKVLRLSTLSTRITLAGFPIFLLCFLFRETGWRNRTDLLWTEEVLSVKIK